MRLLFILSLLIFNSAYVGAADPTQSGSRSFRESLAGTENQEFDARIRLLHQKAQRISLLNTVLPTVAGIYLMASYDDLKKEGAWVLAYGLLVGPSTGHVYLENTKRAVTGFLFRSLGTVVVFSSLVAAGLSGLCEYDCPSDAEVERGMYFGIVTGSALITWSAVKGFLSLNQSALELWQKRNRVDFNVLPGPEFGSFQLQLTYHF